MTTQFRIHRVSAKSGKVVFYSFVFCSLLCVTNSYSQNTRIDSLFGILKAATHDTTRVNTLLLIGDEIYLRNPDSALLICKHSLEICRAALPRSRSQVRKTLLNAYALALNNIGYIYDVRGQIKKALTYYNLSLKIREKTRNKTGMATALGNIGYIYDLQGQIKEALVYYHRSLKILEEIQKEQPDDEGNKSGIAYALDNIGSIYQYQGQINEALNYYHRSLKFQEEIRDKKGIATSFNNIASVYNHLGRIDEALDYVNRTLEIQEEIQDKQGIASSLNNIGSIYKQKGQFKEALKYNQRSLEIQKEIQNKSGIANAMSNIGHIYFKQKKYKEAEEYCMHSLQIAKESGYAENIRNAEQRLAEIFREKGDYRKSLEHYEQYILFRDSIKNLKTENAAMQQRYQYEWEKKEAVMKAEQEKKDAIAMEEKRRQQMFLFSVIGGLLLVILFSVFMFNRWRVTQKQKKIIEWQKTEVEKQKKVVEEKNKNITDSIEYARTIQQALLTSEEYINQYLPDYFIVYLPRDIVSGDFYWGYSPTDSQRKPGEKMTGSFCIAIADCTGHGIPGAFMSLLGMTFLNKIIIEKKILSPDAALNALRGEIIEYLNPTGNKYMKDGMDITLCRFDFINRSLEFAAANRPLLLVRQGLLYKYSGDEMPVGVNQVGGETPFTSKKIQLCDGDMVYLFTDGFSDQFGGPKGKKLSRRTVENLFLTVSNLSAPEQKMAIEKTFNEWKGNSEQTDDVAVMGIRI